MFQDLDINEDGLPPTVGEPNNDPAENGSFASNSTIQNSAPQHRSHLNTHKTIPDAEKLIMPSKFNHRIYRAYIRGKTEQAKRLIDELLKKSSEQICEYAFLIRSLISREEGQIRESMNWLERAITHNPNSLRLTYEIGRTYMLLGEHDRATECFQRCIEKDPNEWKFYYWKASCIFYRRTKNQLETVNEAQECLLLCPRLNKCVNMLMFVAKTCIQRNDIPPAIEAYRIAQELEPENLEVISHLGLLYLKAGNEERAFSCLGKALTYDSTHIPSIIAAASVLQMNGDYDVALSKYRIAATTCDHDGTIWNNIGMCFFAKGKYVASISCLKRANYLCPLDWKILFNLAIVHCAMTQFASAFNFMSSALNLNPSNPMLLIGLAIILTELNDHTNARKAYKKALQLDSDDFIVRLNYAVFEYHHGELSESQQLLQNMKTPKNIDHAQFADVKFLLERLQSSLKQINN